MAGAISFEVGAIFMIEDRATGVLNTLSEQFTALGEKITAVEEKLGAFGKGTGLFEPLIAAVGKVNDALESIIGTASRASQGMAESMAAAGRSVDAFITKLDGIAEAYRRAGAAASNFASAAAAGAGGTAAGAGSSAAADMDGPGSSLVRREGALTPYYPIYDAAGGAAGGAAAGGFIGAEAEIGAEWWRRQHWNPSGRMYDAQYESMTPRLAGPSGPRPPVNYGRPDPIDEYEPGRRRGGSHMLPLIEGAALLESMKSAATEEQSVDLALLRGFHIDPRTATAEQRQYLKSLAHEGAIGTSFSESEVAGGEFTLAAPLGFLGDEGMRRFGSIFPVAAKAAEAAKQLKFGTYEGSLTGAVEFAHQMQMYDAPGLTKAMNTLGAITETLPHGDMEREALVMGYAIPQARALKADPEEAMTAIGFMQRGGLRNTVAATTLRQMLVGQLKTGGPLNAQMSHRVDQEAKELETSLGLKEGHFSGKAGDKTNPHVKALQDLGLLKGGKLTDLNSQGGIDINKMFETIAGAEKSMTPIQFGTSMYNAFGIRGQTGGEMIGESFDQFKKYQQTVAGTAPLDQQLQMIQGNAVQLTGQAIARIGDTGNAIGEVFLPHLKDFDNAVIGATISLRQLIKDHPVATEIGVTGGIIASIYAGWMGLRGAVGSIGRFFGERAGTRALGVGTTAAEEAAAGGAGGVMGWITRVAGGVGLVAGLIADRLANLPQSTVDKYPRIPGFSMPEARVVTSDSHGGTPPAPTAPNVTVTNHITFNGMPDETTRAAIMRWLTDAMHNALSTATGSGAGTSMSPYVGAGVP